jgi:hypothetical protein
MTRHPHDAAQRLLDEYLEHVEKLRNEASPPADPASVVIFDVMRYRRHVPRPVEEEARPVVSS